MEKDLYRKLHPILNELLDELKKNGKIETVYVQTEMDALGVVVKHMNTCGQNYTRLLHVSDNYQEFLRAVKPFGFDEPSSVQLTIEIGSYLAAITTEMFRIALL